MTSGRPAIRVNQVGYLPGRPKRATWVTTRPDPVVFEVRTDRGAIVHRGHTQPWPQRPDPTSGAAVHVLDFGVLAGVPGTCRIHVDGQVSHPFPVADGLYTPLGRDALAVFYLLRSGCAIDEDRAPGYGRPAGHVSDTAVSGWTGPDAERLYPGWQPVGEYDVSGGWYDAGDFGKYPVSGGIALWQLLRLAELSGAAEVLDECRWQLDWMLRMQVPPGRQYPGMVFHRVHGTEWSPIPCWAHEDPTTRVLHRPSTAATLHLAATAATGARVFASRDREYAARLLGAARVAHRAAHREPVLIAPDDEGRYGGGPYGDADVRDDFYWAAVELWLTTGEPAFRDELLGSPIHGAAAFAPDGFDFDRVALPAQLDLAARLDRDVDGAAAYSVVAAAEELRALQAQQPWGQPYAPDGGWDWGSNGRILNNLVVLAGAHALTGAEGFRDGLTEGMDYLLGRNALGQCYVVGYGTDSTAQLRTRQFGHEVDPVFPPPPRGALAGGANSKQTPGFPSDPRLAGLPPQRCYLDEPTSETTNDLCIRWNAPLAFVAAYVDMSTQPVSR